MYADNQHRHGTPPLPKRWFTALQAEFGKACEVLTVLSPDGVPVSSVLSFYFRDEVLPYYAGDVPAARELAANDFTVSGVFELNTMKRCFLCSSVLTKWSHSMSR